MKGNLFLGFGRKSVGDVVFYKRKGSTEQMARARNRKPNNPRSDKQLYQRAIMATVLQAYSAGKAIFDHSFEGKSVPDGSMRRFMSLNLRRLRSAIAEDLANPTDPTQGHVVAPGAVTPVPFAYRISEGSYPNQLLTYDDTTPGDEGFKFPTPDAADTTPALYLSNHGFVPGDIYTIVAFGNDPDNIIGLYGDGNLYGCFFGWIRFQVRADAPTSGELTLDNCFTVTASHYADTSEFSVGIVFGLDEIFDNTDIVSGSIGAIRSRYDSGVRSTSDMVMIGASEFGIGTPDLLDAWRAGTQQVGDPELLLEGAGNNQPRTNPTTPEDLGTLRAVIAGTTVSPSSLTNYVTESTSGTAEALSRVDFKIIGGNGQITQRGNNSMVAVAVQNGRVIASSEAMGAQAEASLGLNSIVQEFEAAPIELKLLFNGRDSGLVITMTYQSGD
jgi:hypothetical protein